MRIISKDWFEKGGLDNLPSQTDDDEETFFYSKRYVRDSGRFEDILQEETDETIPFTPCSACM